MDTGELLPVILPPAFTTPPVALFIIRVGPEVVVASPVYNKSPFPPLMTYIPPLFSV